MVAGPLIPHQFGQRDDLKTKETAAACERLAGSGKLLFIRGFCGFHYYSAAYSGLQECERFSARLPPGQQSSAAFLELRGNAMICRDTPQTLQTTRSTHMWDVHNAAPILLGRMVQIRGKVVSEYWMARPPAWSLPLAREGGTSQNSHLQSATLPLCHFATLPLCHFKESRPGCDVPPPRICEET